MNDLPCDPDGMCMVCKVVPPDEHVLLCSSCTSPWHMQCLNPPLSKVPCGDWSCPDCTIPVSTDATLSHGNSATKNPLSSAVPGLQDDLVCKIRSIQADATLSEGEKSRRRQELMTNQGDVLKNEATAKLSSKGRKGGGRESRNATLELLDNNLDCIFCMQLADRPVTTPCGHNFCLKCFQRWIGQGKKTCGKCRAPIPAKMASQPRINSTLVMAIRMAKAAAVSTGCIAQPKSYQHIQNENRPDKAFTTERAVKTGKANACSGKIFVTIPPDHFGPILAENDPLRNQGVRVGESWEDRMECRQWGAHFPHVAGIAGQSIYGAQSVALSGGYEDDEDHGEWFLYTGSGGRDLSGNKRTSSKQSKEQVFEKSNEALRVSCKHGYPVRVVRSHKEKRSSYAPENGIRYDGTYRIEKCWRKTGIQGFTVCRYLFVRCDNDPAPWTSNEHGDQPRPLPHIQELKSAKNIFERKAAPSWDWKEGVWGWTRDPPSSRKITGREPKSEKTQKRKLLSLQQKLLHEFGCSLCRKVLKMPLSTPCGHNFCKACLDKVFAGQQDTRERTSAGGRSLRVQKVMKRCPTCKGDITEFFTCPQVNRQMEDLIQSLSSKIQVEDRDEHTTKKGKLSMSKGFSSSELHEGIVRDTDDDEEASDVDVDDNDLNQEAEADQEFVKDSEDEAMHGLLSTYLVDAQGVCHDEELYEQRPVPVATAVHSRAWEIALVDLCTKFPCYSGELLRDMLADQRDVDGVGDLMKTLTRMEKITHNSSSSLGRTQGQRVLGKATSHLPQMVQAESNHEVYSDSNKPQLVDNEVTCDRDIFEELSEREKRCQRRTQLKVQQQLILMLGCTLPRVKNVYKRSKKVLPKMSLDN